MHIGWPIIIIEGYTAADDKFHREKGYSGTVNLFTLSKCKIDTLVALL